MAAPSHDVTVGTGPHETTHVAKEKQSSRTPSIQIEKPTVYLSDGAESAGWDLASTKKLIRRIDYHLIPFLALLYLLSFLDRTNIGNARLDNMEKDLNMDPLRLQYNDALAIFFPFYVAAEVPSNMAMKRFRPSIWIPSIMVGWAICTTLMGIVRNYQGLMVARAFLGICEGGLFPGITY